MLAPLNHLLGRARSEPGGPPAFRRYALVGLVAALVTVAGAVAGGQSFVSHKAGAWFFGTPGGPLGFVSSSAKHPPAVAMLAVYGGLGALCALWWRLLRTLRRTPGAAVRDVARVVALWSAPFVVGPPLFSRDLYSYAGQGLMASYHIDPYVYGPGVLGATRFNLLAGPLWANTPSPYGPTFLSIDGFVTHLSGHQVLVDLLLLRLVEVVGVVVLGVGLAALARSFGKDPAAAVLLGAGSPLVLTTLIGGGHNDALMAGLLVAGLAAWRRWGPVPGIVLCALAAGVKAPALLGIVAIGWNWAAPGAGVFRRAGRTISALGIGAATLAAVSAVSGIGWGWLTTVTAADKISTGVTPIDAVAHLVRGVLHLAGSTATTAHVRGVAAVLALAVAAVAGTWWLWRSTRDTAVTSLGLSLLVLALLGPVLWAWYLTWGIAVLAPLVEGWLRRALVWLVVAETLIGASAVDGIFHAFSRYGVLPDIMIVVGVAAAVLGAAGGAFELRSPSRREPAPASGSVTLGTATSPPG